MSLRRRLLLTLAPVFIAGLIAVDIATYLSLKSFLISKVDEQILSVHMSVSANLTSDNAFGRGPQPGPTNNFPPGTFGEIVSASGKVVVAPHDFPGPGGEDATSTLTLPSSLTPQTFLTAQGSSPGDGFRVYVDSVPNDSNGDLLIVALPLDDTAATLAQLLILEVVAGGVITVIILVATWLIVRRGLRPLDRMGRTARIAATDLSQRVEPTQESTEVGRLGLAINAMLSQLETAFAERAANEQRLRHFVSDASHELRTPLTSMRGYAELLRRNPEMSEEDVVLATRRIEEEARRMGILVDDLLLLARLDQGRPLERVPVDLGAIVLDACADARVADPARRVTARINAPAQVIGDDLRLRQVLANLVRNAIVHTPPGTPIEVDLGLSGTHAVIDVVDHGAGIRPDHAQRIFERFHRADPARSGDQGGSGLGLSIAAAVVAAHGGRLDVRDTAGGGATFRIELPARTGTATSPPPVVPPAAETGQPVA
jgi:two-component system, OmpR family, sensor kinase